MIYIKELIFIICEKLSLQDIINLVVNKELCKILKEYNNYINKRIKYYDEYDDYKIVDNYLNYLLEKKEYNLIPKIDGPNGKNHGYYYWKLDEYIHIGYNYNGRKEKCHKTYYVCDDAGDSQIEKILLGFKTPIKFNNYKNDILDGLCMDDDKNSFYQITYDDGEPDGPEYVFSNNNEYFLAEYNWDMGKLSGLSFEYNNGRVVKIYWWYSDRWFDTQNLSYDIIFESNS